jgi:hypothetical protein
MAIEWTLNNHAENNGIRQLTFKETITNSGQATIEYFHKINTHTSETFPDLKIRFKTQILAERTRRGNVANKITTINSALVGFEDYLNT